MIVAQVQRALDPGSGTGARIGRWIDGNFPFAVVIATAAGVVVLALLWIAVRSRLRYRREAKRLRRTYETGIDRRLDELGGRVDRVRDEVRQLGELADHTVAELRRLREDLPSTGLRTPTAPETIVLPRDDEPSERDQAGAPTGSMPLPPRRAGEGGVSASTGAPAMAMPVIDAPTASARVGGQNG